MQLFFVMMVKLHTFKKTGVKQNRTWFFIFRIKHKYHDLRLRI